MPLILHIFRKDAQRMWKEIAVSLALLAWLTRMDSWRAGDAPDSTEGWLNLLLPLVWSYLVALCVLQDPVPGERQFWLTLPHSRATLPGAKILFIAAFIHLPYLLSTAVVVQARGFDPLHFIPRLMEKQLLLLLAVTLPSLALASVARNAMQFIILALSLAGAAILVVGNGNLEGFSYRRLTWQRMDDIRCGLVFLLLALVAVAVIWFQYRQRRTPVSRVAGCVGLLAAALAYLWLPSRSLAALESALSPAILSSPVRVRVLQPGEKKDPDIFSYQRGNAIGIAVPVEVSGASTHLEKSSLQMFSLELDGPGGLHLSPTQPGPGRKPPTFMAGTATSTVSGINRTPDFLILTMEPSLYARAARAPVNVSGYFLLEERRSTGLISVPNTARIRVPDLGLCAGSSGGGNLYREDMLRIACESPDALPLTSVTLTDTVTGRQWKSGLRTASTSVPYPSYAWLSPMQRGEAFFQLTSGDATQQGSQWLVPRQTLDHYRMEVEPQPVIGTAVVDFKLAGIDLRKFVVRHAR